jgi:hypothetical protein
MKVARAIAVRRLLDLVLTTKLSTYWLDVLGRLWTMRRQKPPIQGQFGRAWTSLDSAPHAPQPQGAGANPVSSALTRSEFIGAAGHLPPGHFDPNRNMARRAGSNGLRLVVINQATHFFLDTPRKAGSVNQVSRYGRRLSNVCASLYRVRDEKSVSLRINNVAPSLVFANLAQGGSPGERFLVGYALTTF